MPLETMDVYAEFIIKDPTGDYPEYEMVGDVQLDPDRMPDVLEINGVYYHNMDEIVKTRVYDVRELKSFKSTTDRAWEWVGKLVRGK